MATGQERFAERFGPCPGDRRIGPTCLDSGPSRPTVRSTKIPYGEPDVPDLSPELIELAAAYAQAADQLATARDAAKSARDAADSAELTLVDAATRADNEDIRTVAAAILECRRQIADLIEATDTGKRALVVAMKAAEESFYRAAEQGDARVALATLNEAKTALAERTSEIRDLARVEKAQRKTLLASFTGII
jgi:hypothetical protein